MTFCNLWLNLKNHLFSKPRHFCQVEISVHLSVHHCAMWSAVSQGRSKPCKYRPPGTSTAVWFDNNRSMAWRSESGWKMSCVPQMLRQGVSSFAVDFKGMSLFPSHFRQLDLYWLLLMNSSHTLTTMSWFITYGLTTQRLIPRDELNNCAEILGWRTIFKMLVGMDLPSFAQGDAFDTDPLERTMPLIFGCDVNAMARLSIAPWVSRTMSSSQDESASSINRVAWANPLAVDSGVTIFVFSCLVSSLLQTDVQ